MERKIIVSLVMFFVLLSARSQSVGALTIFSDDGDKFYLILNGQRQNQDAKTNVRVDGLTQSFYSVKVIFENTALPEISKNLGIVDGNNVMMDAVYKIKHDKSGTPKLGGFPQSFTPYQQNTTPAPESYVVHYGSPAPVSTTQTTTTTTTTPATSVNVNVNGTNVGMTVVDPNVTTTQTTVVRSTTTTTESNMQTQNAAPVGCKGAYPMSPGDFNGALATVKNQGFDETKLSTAKQIAKGNCLTANQIAELCKLFGFEETKLTFAKYAYDHCTEPQNYFKLNNIFGFSSSVDDLNKYVESKQ